MTMTPRVRTVKFVHSMGKSLYVPTESIAKAPNQRTQGDRLGRVQVAAALPVASVPVAVQDVMRLPLFLGDTLPLAPLCCLWGSQAHGVVDGEAIGIPEGSIATSILSFHPWPAKTNELFRDENAANVRHSGRFFGLLGIVVSGVGPMQKPSETGPSPVISHLFVFIGYYH
ncbi:MAG: hypothetical protein BWY17_04116 [Deltaproteobacteria bacterium ADurb.Bin207]|nr:MAG: hypothetical protein BWY17_04116 [Deltaproteobacteria bacterium ADurb.Bin207]